MKNNHRGNYICIRSLWLSSFFPAVILVIGVSLGLLFFENITVTKLIELFTMETLIKVCLSYLGAFSITYSILSREHYRKWKYLSELYDKRIATPDGLIQLRLSANLASNVLYLDFWANNFFQGFFCATLEKAIKELYAGSNEAIADTIKKINAKEFTEEDAEDLLNKYLNKLLEFREEKETKT